MNILEENLAPTHLAPLDISAARKRRRQKKLKPLKTPDRLDIKETEKAEGSPVWSLSPDSAREDTTSFGGVKETDVEHPTFHNDEPSTSRIQNVIEADVSPPQEAAISKEDAAKSEQSEGDLDITASTEALEPSKKIKKKKDKSKKSKEKKASVVEDVTSNATTISAALNEIIDTVEIIDEHLPPPKPPRTKSRYSDKGSEISLISDGKVFVQHGRIFTATARDKAFCRTGSQRDNSSIGQNRTTALSMAIAYQKRFLPLSIMCHGLLAGIAIWQCVTVFQQNNNQDSVSFVQNYSGIARVFQSVFYILATISCVAVLDRCMPTSFTWRGLWELLILQPCCLFALAASCGALLSSGISAKLDDRIALHTYNETLWSDNMEADVYLSEWLTTNLVRCVLAVVSYVIVSLCWGDNSSALPFPELATSVKPSSA